MRTSHSGLGTQDSGLASRLRLLLRELPADIADDEPLFAGGLGLDSIDALEIVVMLESEFGIKVKNETAAREHFRSIASLAGFVESRLAQQQNA